MFISRDQTIKPAVSSRYTVHKSIHDMLSMIFSYTPENVWGIYGGVLKVLRRSKGLIRELAGPFTDYAHKLNIV